MTQVYNENTFRGWDGKTNIERFMQSVVQYCDGLVIFDNGSTDGTRDIITKYSGTIEIEIPSNKENSPLYENYHRARCLEHCKRLNADWVLCLHPDEVFESVVERGALGALANTKTTIDGYVFKRRDLWRTDRYIRLDGEWNNNTEARLFKLTDKINYDISPGINKTIVPNGIVNASYSALKILGYGYSTDEQIAHKYRQLKGLGFDIAPLVSEMNIRLCDVNESFRVKMNGPKIDVYNKRISEILA